MLNQTYSNKDLEELTGLARTLWEINVSQKVIQRRPNVIKKNVPVQALYRMVKEAWNSNKNNEAASPFPFIPSEFSRVIGFSDGWSISVNDRKYLDGDMILFASDGHTILISPTNQKWWESGWFNGLSLIIGASGLIAAITGLR